MLFPPINTASNCVPPSPAFVQPQPTGCGTRESTQALLAVEPARLADGSARLARPRPGGDSGQGCQVAVSAGPLSPRLWVRRRRAFQSSRGARGRPGGSPAPPTPHLEGDCAADVRRLWVHSLARGLYFHNSTPRRGTGMGVSSPPGPLPAPGPSLPPTGHTALITAGRREAGIAARGSRSSQGLLPAARRRGKSRRFAPQRRHQGKGGARSRGAELGTAIPGSAAQVGAGREEGSPANGLQPARGKESQGRNSSGWIQLSYFEVLPRLRQRERAKGNPDTSFCSDTLYKLSVGSILARQVGVLGRL